MGKNIWDLPQELVERIIDFVWYDAEALRAYALVHRSWTRTAQVHLHASFRVNWQDDDIDDETMYSNPEVAALVTDVYLCEPPTPTGSALEWRVLSRFKNVKQLRLTCLDWTYCGQENRDKLHAAFGYVTRLKLSSCNWQHGEDFVFFLSAFPNVQELEMDGCGFWVMDSDPMSDRFPPQTVDVVPGGALKSLKIHWTDISHHSRMSRPRWFIKPWLAHLPEIVKEGLHFEWSSEVGFAALPHYLRAMGSAVASLDVGYYRGEHSYPDFGLQTCTELKTIKFKSLCIPAGGLLKRDGDYSWVQRMLSQVCSTELENVLLELEPEKADDLRLLDWEIINSVLASPRFARTQLTLSWEGRAYVRIMLLGGMFPAAQGAEGVKEAAAAFSILADNLKALFEQQRVRMALHGYHLGSII